MLQRDILLVSQADDLVERAEQFKGRREDRGFVERGCERGREADDEREGLQVLEEVSAHERTCVCSRSLVPLYHSADGALVSSRVLRRSPRRAQKAPLCSRCARGMVLSLRSEGSAIPFRLARTRDSRFTLETLVYCLRSARRSSNSPARYYSPDSSPQQSRPPRRPDTQTSRSHPGSRLSYADFPRGSTRGNRRGGIRFAILGGLGIVGRRGLERSEATASGQE